MGRKRRRRWSYSAGERGRNLVNVYERTPGRFYVRTPDDARAGGYRVRALDVTTEEEAIVEAKAEARRIERGDGDRPPAAAGTLGEALDRYVRRHGSRRSDLRRRELFEAVLGRGRSPQDVSEAAWERFIADRRSGAVDARGRRHGHPDYSGRVGEEGKPVGVGARSVEADAVFLRAALKGTGSPVLGYRVPRERNPARARLDGVEERYAALARVAGDVHPFLPTLLALANETGRRIGAIVALRLRDVDLERGTIDWPAESDKARRDWKDIPLSEAAVEALREHVAEHEPTDYLFPAPRSEGHVAKDLASKWLRRAEEAAGVEPMERKLWHVYRARFATELLAAGVAVPEIMRLGGWTRPDVILTTYAAPTGDQMRDALGRRNGGA